MPRGSRRAWGGAAIVLALATVPGLSEPDEGARTRQVIEGYADFAHRLYSDCVERAKSLDRALEDFLKEPSEETLASARDAWLHARRIYGQTEVLRFYNGPIDNPRDGVETFLNAWPLDEAYIDYVEGDPGSGIINDPTNYPNLSGALLTLLNERGGEANIAIGWHAVEFLLWGQDHDVAGAGKRSFTDYQLDGNANAARRGEYLRICGDLVVEHHEQVRDAWAKERDNYRASFLADSEGESLRKILAGMIVLSGFEMSGERLAVAYETQDQEEEHSCFSDNTHIDFIADQEGILAVYFGEERGGVGPGVQVLAREAAPKLAERIEKLLIESLDAIRGMPVPFDMAIRGDDSSENRKAVLRALVALERQSEALATLALVFGFEIAIQPGG